MRFLRGLFLLQCKAHRVDHLRLSSYFKENKAPTLHNLAVELVFFLSYPGFFSFKNVFVSFCSEIDFQQQFWKAQLRVLMVSQFIK